MLELNDSEAMAPPLVELSPDSWCLCANAKYAVQPSTLDLSISTFCPILRPRRHHPFRCRARSPNTVIAQPPHLRRLTLISSALLAVNGPAHPGVATPSMRLLYIGARLTLHVSSPHSVALMQLRFTLLAVNSSQRDLHPQVCAHAGRTQKKTRRSGFLTNQQKQTD